MNKRILFSILLLGGNTLFGQSLVKNLQPGFLDSSPRKMVSHNGKMYFFGRDTLDGNFELWVSDGTSSGTHLVKDIYPAGGAIDYDSPLISLGPYLYFRARESASWAMVLWRSDGTAAGTIKLSSSQGGSDENFIAYNGKLYFSSIRSTTGRELWKTDGTVAGTAIVIDLDPGMDDGIPGNSSMLGIEQRAAVVGSQLYFVGNNGTSGYEIFKTSGTAASTSLVKDELLGNNTNYIPRNLIELNGNLYFTFLTSGTEDEIYKSDGTAAGTGLLKDINPGTDGSFCENFTVFNGKLYFTAITSSEGRELWKTDGTLAGTTMVKSINPGPGDMSYVPVELEAGGNCLFFSADGDGNLDMKLWRTDGTTNGTYLIKDVSGNIGSSMLNNLYYSGGLLYFTGQPPVSNTQLKIFISDGTAQGTTKVNDNYNGLIYAYPANYYAFGGKIYFSAKDGINGDELWVLDPLALNLDEEEKDVLNCFVFPNPFKQELTLSTKELLGETKIKVFGFDGSLIKETSFQEQNKTLDLGNLPTQAYLLEISSGNKKRIIKLIKE